MLRDFFVYKIQCELSCPRSTRKVSGLLEDARQGMSGRYYPLLSSQSERARNAVHWFSI